MSAVYRKFCFEWRQNARSGIWGLSLASMRGAESTRPAEALCAPGQVPAFSVLLHLKAGVWGQVQGLVGTGRAIVHGVPRTGAQNPGVLILKIKNESPENSPHPPYAPAHGSLLTFNCWLIFLSLFGDSEFPEGRNHDFLSFFPMVLCWRDTQQIVEWMSGWMNEWGSTNQSSSVVSSLIDNKLPDLTWKCLHSGSAALFRVWVPLGMPTAAQPWDHGVLLLAPKTCLAFLVFEDFFFSIILYLHPKQSITIGKTHGESIAQDWLSIF